MKNKKVELLHKTEKNIKLINQAYDVLQTLERENTEYISKWILNLAKLKEVI